MMTWTRGARSTVLPWASHPVTCGVSLVVGPREGSQGAPSAGFRSFPGCSVDGIDIDRSFSGMGALLHEWTLERTDRGSEGRGIA